MYQRFGLAAMAAGAMVAHACADIESVDAQPGAEFGSTVVVEGFTWAIGAPEHDSGIGRVELNSIIQGTHEVLENPDPDACQNQGCGFGQALALTGTFCVVGAPGHDGRGANAGMTWVYRRTISGWALEQSLSAPDARSGEEAGHAVAAHGSQVFVGVPGADATENDGGAVRRYVPRVNGQGWVLDRTLLVQPNDGPFFGGARFGEALATDGRFLVAGAPGLHDNRFFVYRIPGYGSLPGPEMITWRPEAIDAPTAEWPNSKFGRAVAVERNLVAVGAPDWGASYGPGAVFLYRLVGGTWTHEATLESSDGEDFGASLAIDNGMVVVGDPGAGAGGRVHVYIHHDGGWVEQTPAFPSVQGDRSGAAVAIESGQLYVGAPGNDGGLVRVETVLSCRDCNGNGECDEDEIVLDPLFGDCNEDGLLDACQGLLDCDGNGVPDLCEDGTEAVRCLPQDGTIPVEVLLLEDTSGSTDQERKIVCGLVDNALATLDSDEAIQVEAWWTRIAEFPNGVPCLNGNEFPIPLGSPVPDCGSWEPRTVETTEDWGDAISHAVANFSWRADGVRIVVVLSDEGPSMGGTCGEDDGVTIGIAASLAELHGVQVLPAALPGTYNCVFDGSDGLMADLADAAHGSVLDARDLSQIDPGIIAGRIVDAIDQSPYVQTCSVCIADIDGDGEVGSNDLLLVISDWGLADSPADINGDGTVDSTDLLEVIAGWGVCP